MKEAERETLVKVVGKIVRETIADYQKQVDDLKAVNDALMLKVESLSAGTPGPQGEAGPQGDIGPQGEAGRLGEAGPRGEPGPQGEPGAKGLDGAPGQRGNDGRHGEKGIDGRDGRDGKDGIHGRDGLDGKDALEIAILSSIHEGRNYQRGTFAYDAGGLKRFDGNDWQVICNGVADVALSVDEAMQFEIKATLTDGTARAVQCTLPGISYKGVWKDGDFVPGDCVTHDGSMWMALTGTKSKPGEYNKDWQLCVKRGRNGKSV